MISESQQEQAALHALGLLDADEAAAFERALAAEPELVRLERELREAAATLARGAERGIGAPPAGLRTRVLADVAAPGDQVPNVIRPRFGWVPWAVAALLVGCVSLLALERMMLLDQLMEARRTALSVPAPDANDDLLSQVAFCELEPTPDASAQPRAAVLWDAKLHKGVLRVTRFTPAAEGKDYQLWAVEAARKEPVSAGVVHVDREGHADVRFRPDAIPGDNTVQALAISLERVGGSPTNQGPILFLGKL